jgi:thiol-disulfide isomerase/thioredoxin
LLRRNHIIIIGLTCLLACNSKPKEAEEKIDEDQEELKYERQEYKEGDVLPNRSVQDAANKRMDLFVQGKTNIVIFWASWCLPCRAEIPSMKTLYQEIGNNDSIRMISVSLDDEEKEWTKALKEVNMAWPQAIAQGELESVEAKYGFAGIPYVIIADKNRRLVKGILGYDEKHLDTIKDCLSKMR